MEAFADRLCAVQTLEDSCQVHESEDNVNGDVSVLKKWFYK